MFQGLVILYISALGFENHIDYLFVFYSLCPKEASDFGIRPFGQIASEIWSIGVLAICGTCLVLMGTNCWTVLWGSERMTLWGFYCTFTLMYDLSGMRHH